MNMNKTPEAGDKMLEARDIESRIDDLEGFKAEFEESADDLATINAEPDGHTAEELAEAQERDEDVRNMWDRDAEQELAMWLELRDQCDSDWYHGARFIEDDGINRQFARDWYHDIHSTESGVNMGAWPYNHIDWDAAVEDLKADFTVMELDVPQIGKYTYYQW